MAKRLTPLVRFSRLPKGVRDAGAARIERQQARETVADVLHVTEKNWIRGRARFNCIEHLSEQNGSLDIMARQCEADRSS